MMDVAEKMISVAEAWVACGMDSLFRSDVGHCVNATRVGIDALAGLGVIAQPAACGIIVWNDHWSVGVDPSEPAEPGKIAEHLLIYVDPWVLDLSFTQFHRPAKGLECPVPLFGKIEEGWEIGESVTFEGALASVRLERVPLPAGLRSMPGFQLARNVEPTRRLRDFLEGTRRKT